VSGKFNFYFIITTNGKRAARRQRPRKPQASCASLHLAKMSVTEVDSTRTSPPLPAGVLAWDFKPSTHHRQAMAGAPAKKRGPIEN
jgi:hypothetical protein